MDAGRTFRFALTTFASPLSAVGLPAVAGFASQNLRSSIIRFNHVA
jgi:hypothetical protein